MTSTERSPRLSFLDEQSPRRAVPSASKPIGAQTHRRTAPSTQIPSLASALWPQPSRLGLHVPVRAPARGPVRAPVHAPVRAPVCAATVPSAASTLSRTRPNIPTHYRSTSPALGPQSTPALGHLPHSAARVLGTRLLLRLANSVASLPGAQQQQQQQQQQSHSRDSTTMGAIGQ